MTPQIRRTLTRLLVGVAGLAVVFDALVSTSYWWEFRAGDVTVPRTGSPMLDESEAVRTTKSALGAAGIDILAARPVPFRPPSSTVFARNESGPNEGYVLWKIGGSRRVWDYIVRCEWHSDRAHCSVSLGE